MGAACAHTARRGSRLMPREQDHGTHFCPLSNDKAAYDRDFHRRNNNLFGCCALQLHSVNFYRCVFSHSRHTVAERNKPHARAQNAAGGVRQSPQLTGVSSDVLGCRHTASVGGAGRYGPGSGSSGEARLSKNASHGATIVQPQSSKRNSGGPLTAPTNHQKTAHPIPLILSRYSRRATPAGAAWA